MHSLIQLLLQRPRRFSSDPVHLTIFHARRCTVSRAGRPMLDTEPTCTPATAGLYQGALYGSVRIPLNVRHSLPRRPSRSRAFLQRRWHQLPPPQPLLGSSPRVSGAESRAATVFQACWKSMPRTPLCKILMDPSAQHAPTPSCKVHYHLPLTVGWGHPSIVGEPTVWTSWRNRCGHYAQSYR